jgi:hypothetical protein
MTTQNSRKEPSRRNPTILPAHGPQHWGKVTPQDGFLNFYSYNDFQIASGGNEETDFSAKSRKFGRREKCGDG